jgi:hypothetical protein
MSAAEELGARVPPTLVSADALGPLPQMEPGVAKVRLVSRRGFGVFRGPAWLRGWSLRQHFEFIDNDGHILDRNKRSD